MERHGDVGALAGQRLIDGVVDHLIDQVVETIRPSRANVHSGPHSNRLESLQDGDRGGVVVCTFGGVVLGFHGGSLRPCSCRVNVWPEMQA